MSMDVQVNHICKTSYYHLSKIASIRSLLDRRTTEALIQAFVFSRLNYCNSLLFGITKQNMAKLQKVQNKAARICLKVSRKQHRSSISLLKELQWLPISFCIEYSILLLTFKCLNNLAPKYLSDLLQYNRGSRQTRSSQLDLLVVPKSRTKSFGDRSFEYAAPTLWNNLPLSIRKVESVVGFKLNLKRHLRRIAYAESV